MKWMSLVALLFVLPITARAAEAHASAQDRGWLVAAHETNLAEMQSGDLAAKSGHSQAVRNVGRMLATDHKALDAKLLPVARVLHVKLPDQPSAKQRDEMQHFETLSGMQFDKAWAHDEADGHVRAIELTEREIEKGSNPQVKQLAKAALPVLKKHLSALKHASTEITGR